VFDGSTSIPASCGGRCPAARASAAHWIARDRVLVADDVGEQPAGNLEHLALVRRAVEMLWIDACDHKSPSTWATGSCAKRFGRTFFFSGRVHRSRRAKIHARGPFRAAAGESKASPSMLPPQCFARALRA
jgi:hypothetical protein